VLKISPAVFAVGDQYQIMVQLSFEALMGVIVADRTYYDESNGIMNSLSPLHRVTVPMEDLNRAGNYTLWIKPIVKRVPYFTQTEDAITVSYPFYPVPDGSVRAYHISDAHNQIENPIQAARAFGKIDFLILNGDIIDHSGSPDKFTNIYEICAGITGGSIPVVFSRGNHDMRGKYAERFADYTPNHHGNTYYTFRLGSIWGIVLDCGEDKWDAHPEYGYTVACHSFRERQTEYIKDVIHSAQNEHEDVGVKTKLVIVHIPFTEPFVSPFDIETDIYREWALLLKEYIKPDLMLCGHTHQCKIQQAESQGESLQPCPLVIGSEPQSDRFIGCGLTIQENQMEISFTDSFGNMVLNSKINR